MPVAHMIADDIKAHAGLVPLNLPTLKIAWILKVIAPAGEGEMKIVLLSIAEQNIKDCAASSFVGFQEHKVVSWYTEQ